MEDEDKKKNMVVTTIRLPVELQEKLKAAAGARGMTWNAYVLTLLWKE